ncbi:MAG: DUF342 domain-containing protein [Desulfovibrionaceae bacterium]|nr:DUF342 domain-containing protein [Desulfovibrionaceae bacterium]MBF0514510.1 DUF342 domain-containing protein [Desulfovibrionaceae bacterium]
MPYYLDLLFKPRLDGGELKPKELESGGVDLFDLGLIQNVIAGQPLANWREVGADEAKSLRPELLFASTDFPMGPGVMLNPGDKNQLLSGVNGAVSFSGGKIEVRQVIRHEGDVGPRSGNIFFVGDFQATGTVHSGYKLQARNVRIADAESGSQIKAQESLFIENGVIGSPKTVMEAGANLRAGFCENAILIARGNMLIEKSCVNCKIYAGPYLAVRGTLTGRKAYVREKLYVGERLGSKMGANTQIVIGFDPSLLVKAKMLELAVRELRRRQDEYQRQVDAGDNQTDEFARRLDNAMTKMTLLVQQKRLVWDQIAATTSSLEDGECCVIVPGQIYPGVEISIGPYHYEVEEPMQNVRLSVKDHEITITSPAS